MAALAAHEEKDPGWRPKPNPKWKYCPKKSWGQTGCQAERQGEAEAEGPRRAVGGAGRSQSQGRPQGKTRPRVGWRAPHRPLLETSYCLASLRTPHETCSMLRSCAWSCLALRAP